MKLNIVKLRSEIARNEVNLKMLSEKCGVSRNTLSAINAGKSCGFIALGKIAKALGVDPADLLEEAK